MANVQLFLPIPMPKLRYLKLNAEMLCLNKIWKTFESNQPLVWWLSSNTQFEWPQAMNHCICPENPGGKMKKNCAVHKGHRGNSKLRQSIFGKFIK